MCPVKNGMFLDKYIQRNNCPTSNPLNFSDEMKSKTPFVFLKIDFWKSFLLLPFEMPKVTESTSGDTPWWVMRENNYRRTAALTCETPISLVHSLLL